MRPLTCGKDPLIQSAEYSPMRFDAELGASSIFKGPPRDELDKAWKSIVDSICSLLILPYV